MWPLNQDMCLRPRRGAPSKGPGGPPPHLLHFSFLLLSDVDLRCLNLSMAPCHISIHKPSVQSPRDRRGRRARAFEAPAHRGRQPSMLQPFNLSLLWISSSTSFNTFLGPATGQQLGTTCRVPCVSSVWFSFSDLEMCTQLMYGG